MNSLTQLNHAGTQDQVVPIDCVSDKETRQRHIDLACLRGLPECQVGNPRKGKLAVVASGPSVADYVDELRSWDGEIWGINGAFHWMRARREIPATAFIGADPEAILVDYLVNPPQEAVYYLASQVHPEAFDHLRDRNVQLWHMSDKEVKWPIGTVTVHGGSSCLTRAPWLACMLGWEDVHIFGGDSSFTHKTHVYGGELPSNFCFVEVDRQLYKTHKVMMVQATDCVDMVQSFPGKITIHGDGLMPALLQQYKDTGVHEWLAKQEAQESRAGLNRKERRRLKKSLSSGAPASSDAA